MHRFFSQSEEVNKQAGKRTMHHEFISQSQVLMGPTPKIRHNLHFWVFHVKFDPRKKIGFCVFLLPSVTFRTLLSCLQLIPPMIAEQGSIKKPGKSIQVFCILLGQALTTSALETGITGALSSIYAFFFFTSSMALINQGMVVLWGLASPLSIYSHRLA